MAKNKDDFGGRVVSVIGKKTQVEGILRVSELCRIEGVVKGTVVSEGTVIVARGGLVDGKIDAKNILIGGVVHGEVFASGRIEANPTGEIYANLHTKALVVDENAVFEGQCEMLRDDPDTQNVTKKKAGRKAKTKETVEEQPVNEVEESTKQEEA